MTSRQTCTTTWHRIMLVLQQTLYIIMSRICWINRSRWSIRPNYKLSRKIKARLRNQNKTMISMILSNLIIKRKESIAHPINDTHQRSESRPCKTTWVGLRWHQRQLCLCHANWIIVMRTIWQVFRLLIQQYSPILKASKIGFKATQWISTFHRIQMVKTYRQTILVMKLL